MKRTTVDFSSETMEVGSKGNEIFIVVKEKKNLNLRIRQVKIFRNKDEKKIDSDK